MHIHSEACYDSESKLICEIEGIPEVMDKYTKYKYNYDVDVYYAGFISTVSFLRKDGWLIETWVNNYTNKKYIRIESPTRHLVALVDYFEHSIVIPELNYSKHSEERKLRRDKYANASSPCLDLNLIKEDDIPAVLERLAALADTRTTKKLTPKDVILFSLQKERDSAVASNSR